MTKPVTLDVTFNGSGTPPMTQLYVVGFNATTTLKRSDFGMKFIVGPVSDEVKLWTSVEAFRD